MAAVIGHVLALALLFAATSIMGASHPLLEQENAHDTTPMESHDHCSWARRNSLHATLKLARYHMAGNGPVDIGLSYQSLRPAPSADFSLRMTATPCDDIGDTNRPNPSGRDQISIDASFCNPTLEKDEPGRFDLGIVLDDVDISDHIAAKAAFDSARSVLAR